jgi:hypothetical protein
MEASTLEQRQKIVEALDSAAKQDPAGVKVRTDEIQRDIVRLRDRLIERLRSAGTGPAFGKHNEALNAVNTALSLLASVEYPVTAIQRSPLKQAHDELAGVPAESFLEP